MFPLRVSLHRCLGRRLLVQAALKQVTLSFGRTGVVIVGGGPAGLAPLLAAHRRGHLADLLKQGVTVVEQSGSVGEGSIGRWGINSDSTGFTLADCLTGPSESELANLRNHPITKEFLAAGDGTVPLRRAGEFLALVGQEMNEARRRRAQWACSEAAPGHFDREHRNGLAHPDPGYRDRTRANHRFPQRSTRHRSLPTSRAPAA